MIPQRLSICGLNLPTVNKWIKLCNRATNTTGKLLRDNIQRDKPDMKNTGISIAGLRIHSALRFDMGSQFLNQEKVLALLSNHK